MAAGIAHPIALIKTIERKKRKNISLHSVIFLFFGTSFSSHSIIVASQTDEGDSQTLK